MALGGVLRAALKAGNWARAAAESRRQARALRQFSPEFGTGRGTSAEEFLRRRGVDVDAMLAPGTGNPYMDWVADFDGPRGYYADSPFGGVVQGSVRDGVERRFRPAPEMYSPIVAPYEGFRALPGLVDDSGMTALAPAPWQGRGQGPMWGTGQWSNFGGSPRSGFVSGYDELGEVLYPSPVPMEQIYRDDRWWYPQFRNPDRSIPKAFRGR